MQLEAETRRRQEEAALQKHLVEERRAKNLERAHQEMQEAKRKAEEKLRSSTHRMDYLEEERRQSVLDRLTQAEARSRERRRTKEEAERRLMEKISVFMEKERTSEETLCHARYGGKKTR